MRARFRTLPCLLLLLLAGCQSGATTRAASRPNFLLIVVDDMGLADLGSFGGEIPTPNLDRLALAGIRFTNFHAAPVCSATRAMLLTGVDSHKAGLGNMAEDLAPNQIGMAGHEGELNGHVVTIASLLQNAGYATFMTGKWHLGKALETSPWAKGFDHSFALLAGAASHYPDMQPAYSPDPKGKAPYREDQQLLESLPTAFKYSTQFYTDRMIDYLSDKRAAEQPFFAYLAYTAPHWPLQAPPEAIARYQGAYDAGYASSVWSASTISASFLPMPRETCARCAGNPGNRYQKSNSSCRHEPWKSMQP
jgi:arylsulfatase A-like enzyme